MTVREPHHVEDRLFLRSQLSEIARIPPWIGTLALRCAIPKNVEFAINLCLEEVVSNIIRHGYGVDADGPVTIRFTMPAQDSFIFIVEDEAQHFNPLDVITPNRSGTVKVGGQGIHFFRHFADIVEYELSPTGNRLKMSFSAAHSAL